MNDNPSNSRLGWDYVELFKCLNEATLNKSFTLCSTQINSRNLSQVQLQKMLSLIVDYKRFISLHDQIFVSK
jgi:hypothetical protein